MNRLLTFLVSLFLISCGNGAVENITIREYGRVMSSIGHEAYVYEALSEPEVPVTQVMVTYSGGNCGIGVVSAYSSGLNFILRWRKGNILVINAPNNVDLQWNSSGQFFKCGEQSIRAIVEHGDHA